jgi:hypothetical protein
VEGTERRPAWLKLGKQGENVVEDLWALSLLPRPPLSSNLEVLETRTAGSWY